MSPCHTRPCRHRYAGRGRSMTPQNETARRDLHIATGTAPQPGLTGQEHVMPETLTRAENPEPALTPPPSPAKPPEIPGGGRFTALAWLAGGRTPADAAAMAGSITGWVARRTAGGLQLLTDDERLVRYLEVILDELAAERLERAERLAADMAALEAEGWTQETARAALSLDAADDDTPDCPEAGDGGSHSISWHRGGYCDFCQAPPKSRAALALPEPRKPAAA